MSKSERRRSEARKREFEDKIPKWYYDACVLDEKLIWGEMTEFFPKKPLISHLALGEAYGNCLKKGNEAAKSFLKLIDLMEKRKFLNIVGNDGVESIFNEIKNNDHIRLDIMDAIHLATAIHHKCCILKTSDEKDFVGHKDKIREFVKEKYGFNFSVSIIKLR